MDVKAFLGHMARQDLDKAFMVIEKTLPLPEILARICDHPCENQCIRNHLDAPVGIGTLERICAAGRSRKKKRFFLPGKEKRVGIWGSGLSSLTVAWDLGLKGYEVSLFDTAEPFGGHLRLLDSDILPPGIIDQELGVLETFGVSFKIEASPEKAFGDISAFDAIYMGFDCREKPGSWIACDAAGNPETDDFSLSTAVPGVFAGGFSITGQKPCRTAYPVGYAAQGRKAAVSMDWFMSKVSITAGREKEGAYPTRLSTDISGIAAQPRVVMTHINEDPDLETASKEACRCIFCDCSRCVRVCTYIASFKGFPGKYAREIYNNGAIVMGEKKANLLINSCSLCNLCTIVCPNDFSMADLCLSARQEMVDNGKMPVSAHEFALQEMRFASGEDCFFVRHEPGYDRSSQLFFPGCQLLGSAPAQVEKVYAFLRTRFSGGTGFASGCCGAPAHWAGRKALPKKTIEPFKTFWEKASRPVIITACTSCTQMLMQGLETPRIISLYEQLVQSDILPEVSPGHCLSPEVSIIDPCTARETPGVQDAVRILTASAGIRVQEISRSGTFTECCGFGGLTYNANPRLSRKIIQQRAAQRDCDYLTYCAMCRDRLASAGKRVYHVLDLFWPETEHPEQRGDPGFSRRHNNMALAKPAMLKRVWKENDLAPSLTTPFHIQITSQVEQVMELEFILLTDIQRVLVHFETGADHFFNPETDTWIAFFRPVNVCFWIEFRKNRTGYEILNTWSHRMAVIANHRFDPGTATEEQAQTVWCRTCNKPLENFKNHAEYLGSRFDLALPQCRQCGLIYISPALARGKMAEVEKILEDK